MVSLCRALFTSVLTRKLKTEFKYQCLDGLTSIVVSEFIGCNVSVEEHITEQRNLRKPAKFRIMIGFNLRWLLVINVINDTYYSITKLVIQYSQWKLKLLSRSLCRDFTLSGLTQYEKRLRGLNWASRVESRLFSSPVSWLMFHITHHIARERGGKMKYPRVSPEQEALQLTQETDL